MAVVVTLDRSPDVAALLARAAEFDTSGGAYTLDDAMASATVYAVRDEPGALLFAWSMDLHRDRLGAVAYVTAAAGRDLAAVLPLIEREARELGANRLQFKTMRASLVRKMRGAGFVTRAAELEKSL